MSAVLSASPRIAMGRLLPYLVVLTAMLVLFRETGQAMVGIWSRSETFAHAFLVPPIVLWLVWRRRAQLASQPQRAQPWLLLPFAGACLLWALGEAVGVNAATQFALVLLIVTAVPAVLGIAMALEIAFPLAFLFFAVPIGEFMVPHMMEWTADFTVAALVLSGIPVYREGLQFVIPSGNWSVVEACSGVRYLIASFMVGTLFAYLNYQSLSRRLLFILVSLIVPVVANWLRAYLIVLVGHLSGNKLAAGADHLIYGWVFFGMVILVMFVIGSRWTEPDVPAPVPSDRKGDMATVTGLRDVRTWSVVAAMIAMMVGSQATSWRDSQPQGGTPVSLTLPSALGDAWVLSSEPLSDWAPDYQGPNASASGTYRNGASTVAVWVGYYRDQTSTRKLVTTTNLVVEPNSTRWAVVRTGRHEVPTAAGRIPVSSLSLRQPSDPAADARLRLQVVRLYWVGGHLTGSESEARIRQGLNRLLGRGDDGAVIYMSTTVTERQDGGVVLDAFVPRLLEPLSATLGAAAAN